MNLSGNAPLLPDLLCYFALDSQLGYALRTFSGVTDASTRCVPYGYRYQRSVSLLSEEKNAAKTCLAGWVALGTRTHTPLDERMEDRDFNELDLRRMLEHARAYRSDLVEGRWVIEARHQGQPWEVIMEPDESERLLVVITAYPVSR